MKAKDWVVFFQGFDPEEEVIAIVYDRSLFGDENLVHPVTGVEYSECPKEIWRDTASDYEVRDYVSEQIWDDIRCDLQETMQSSYDDAKKGGK